MPEMSINAPVDEAQPLLKKECPDCGAPVFGRTMHKQYCEDCRQSRKLENYRSAAERQRRKKGIRKVKGTTFNCGVCGSESLVRSKRGNDKYCVECAPIAALEYARKYSYDIDKDGTRKRVGRIELCAHCGDDFAVIKKGIAIYCDDCRSLSKGGKLPHLYDARRKWRRERYRKDPAFALDVFMRSGILASLGDKKSGNSWTKFVDYSVDELKIHLEKQFLPGMNWGNRGYSGWHIDHIVPRSSFDFDGPDHPDFKACWALTNLRPMWAADNIRKKDKRLYLV